MAEGEFPVPPHGERLGDGPRRRPADELPRRSWPHGQRTLVFRCSEGHLFRLSWWWSWSSRITGLWIGFAGVARCPAGKHWASVKLVNERDLTEQDREILGRQPFSTYEGLKLNCWIAVLIGVACLAISLIVEPSWWMAGLFALWITLWGALFLYASRREAIE